MAMIVGYFKVCGWKSRVTLWFDSRNPSVAGQPFYLKMIPLSCSASNSQIPDTRSAVQYVLFAYTPFFLAQISTPQSSNIFARKNKSCNKK
jgi:hypothetical protein